VSRNGTETSTDDTAQVFTPFRRGIPALGPYVRDMWSRRLFAMELARAELRTANSGTGLGQLWLILNPLLLTFVYYLLVAILRSNSGGMSFLAHVMAGMFLYYFFSSSVTGGAASIVSSGRLILNTAFPKALLPLSVVLVSFWRFLPSLLIYVVVHLAAGLDVSWATLWAFVPMVCMVVLAAGMSMLLATLNVYFRDTRSFLPYIMRIWLYMSPVLWTVESVQGKISSDLAWVSVPLRFGNPLFSIIGSWSDCVVRGTFPGWGMLGTSAAWAVGGFLLGSYVLLSREREFAVRL
jgi:teichoic acid transport system permease protein